ncbi:ribonuclease HI [Sphingomonas palmae]|uniref:Ribonuclease HI n=1 Tax=Sphingomonas palmae TaxID=1855283 RepID=A0A1H7SWA9_9SPHN|nr:reverse transcriptase-like protein [Sphingomonas palmae]SEL76214.1 ribonuclease HI [Sphingomonas palmae]
MGARVKVFFDGGLRPLPGGMETAVVIAGQPFVARGLGAGTSMEAEWLALIDAARRVVAQGLGPVVLLGDAAAVVAQANGRAKVPAAHEEHLATFLALKAAGMPMRVRHIGRSQNLAGIALAAGHAR